ncbi:hypothetical protein [Roseicella frigidaeris]|uniref:Uncharacterized protein n=1 Tax=Roseicella frigidaeris TaxID=2230885 RepID=A0A327LXK8_9PROT|nr:hypothetical protein [Roseicella frigidaeris]RAI54655.1 hypothetical protein DOO78_25620 [Roseicella frigidaeris]
MAGEIDFGDVLGAAEEGSAERLTLYIPSQDRNGVAFDPGPWIEDALKLLSSIGGGATAMPPADGAWLDLERQTLVREKVVLVYTFIDPERLEEKLSELRRYLHRLGRETGQGEVVCEFQGVLFKIRDYDQ